MKSSTRKTAAGRRAAGGKGIVVKSISLPQALADEVQAKRIDNNPEMSLSQHVRSLLRKDLEAAAKESTLAPGLPQAA